MAFSRPGVYVQESLLQQSPSVLPTTTVAAFIGVASRGPLEPTLITSWTQFQRIYGGFAGSNLDLAHSVFQYFNNGGGLAYIVRVVGSAPALASRTLVDRTPTTPVNVLDVDSANPGAWGNQIYVEVPGAALASQVDGRFDIIVRYGGTGTQHVVERWTDLSMDPLDPRYAPGVINSAVAGSVYIRVEDKINRASPFDPEVNIPAVSDDPGGDVLTAGSDGGAPTTSADGNFYTALDSLSSIDSYLTINIPNQSGTDLINAAIAWVEARGSAFLIIDGAANRTPAQAVTDAVPLNPSSYAAIYYPHVVVADPSNAVPNSTKMIPPGGLVAGQFAASDAARGLHRAPAGTSTRLAGVVALNHKALDAELDALNIGGINAIRSIPGVGFCIFGARTLKKTQIDKYIGARRTLTSIRMALVATTRFAIFEPNNELLWARIREQCNRVLQGIYQEGGLRGTNADQAYFVKCDAENNPQASVDAGEVHIEVGVALNSPAEFVILRIGQFESGSSVTEEV